MVRAFVRHSVVDYTSWKKGYDAFKGKRVEMGVKGEALFQLLGDPNDVSGWLDFETLEAAQAFVGSKALRKAMDDAGVLVEETLKVWYCALPPAHMESSS